MAVQSNYKTTTTQSLGNNSATDLNIYLDTLPNASTGYLVLDPEGSNYEIIYYESKGATYVTCPASNGRGLSLTATTKTTVAGNVKIHGPGTTVIQSPDHYLLNNKLDIDGSNLSTAFDFNVSGTNFHIKRDGSDLKLSDDNQAAVSLSDLAGAAGVNDKVKVSNNDTTAGYLNGKLVAGTSITLTEGVDGGNETLTIRAIGTLANTITDVTATAAEINTPLDGVSASVTAANLNTLTAGVASNADTLHTHAELGSFAGVAGEAIDGSATPKAIAIGGTNFKAHIRTETASNTLNVGSSPAENTSFGGADATSRFAQSFVFTDADAETITVEKISVLIGKVASPVDNLTITIQTNSGSLPSGTVIANGTSNVVAGSGISTGSEYGFVTFTFATPPTITSGTTYWFVLQRSAALDAVNYYKVGRHGSSLVTGDYATYTGSTTTWAAGSNRDAYHDIRFNVNYNGQVFKADADNYGKCNYIGFTSSNVADAGAPSVKTSGIITMSGLTPGANYYVDTTSGAITASPSASSCLIPVGQALSATQLLINRGLKTIQKTYSTLRLCSSGNTTTVTTDLFTPTGFKPAFIEIACSASGDANQNSAGVYRYVYGAAVPSLFINAMGSQIVTLQSTASPDSGASTTGQGFDTSTYLAVSNIYENGFDLRYVSNDYDHAFTNVYITAYGY